MPLIARRTALAGAAAALTLAAPRPASAIDPALVEAARKEGAATWYTTLIVGQIVRPMIAAFEAAYPFVKVGYVPAPWQETVLRVLNEAKAGQVRGDLVDGGIPVYPLNDAGLIAPYIAQAATNYPPDFKDPAGLWTANISQVVSPAVNTDQVTEAEIPKTLEDLLHPRWKGKMAWTTSEDVTGPAGFIGVALMKLGNDRGMAYLRQLAAQQIANVAANQRVVLDQCIAGQYPVVLCVYNYHADISAAQGAPVRWLKLAPLQTLGNIALLKNSPHPNAGRLFFEFMLTDEGQRIYAKAGYVPASPTVPANSASLKPGPATYEATLITRGTFVANQGEWLKVYKDLFI